MHRLPATFCVLLMGCYMPCAAADDNADRQKELDALWTEVSRSVKAGDFDGYAATCHTRGVLVSGAKRTSYPLTKALAGWKQGFIDTKAGELVATVEFRFSQRIGDATTAHETGIFCYSTVDSSGKKATAYIHFEALLVKQDGRWQVMMEYQKSPATEKEWNAIGDEAS